MSGPGERVQPRACSLDALLPGQWPWVGHPQGQAADLPLRRAPRPRKARPNHCWSRWTTIVAVLMLAVIAAVVSYSHMYELALRHGEPEWRAALFPLSVDGMIVASSMTLLSDARNGRKGGLLPWALLIIGSGASLAANVAVADPTTWSRIIHAWPSFALIGAYELLMRAFRTAARSVRSADAERTHSESEPQSVAGDLESSLVEQQESLHLHVVKAEGTGRACACAVA